MHRPPTPPPSPRSWFADPNNKTPREIGKSSIIHFPFIYVLSEEEEFTRLPYDTQCTNKGWQRPTTRGLIASDLGCCWCCGFTIKCHDQSIFPRVCTGRQEGKRKGKGAGRIGHTLGNILFGQVAQLLYSSY